MGEYVMFEGRRVQVGSGQDLFQVRADQVGLVEVGERCLDVVTYRDVLRFRFPFPGEDGIAPGAFAVSERAERVPGVRAPEALDSEHYRVQFSAPCGARVSLVCPGVSAIVDYENRGPRPGVSIVQQRWTGDVLTTVCRCEGCGLKWRMPTLAEAQPVIAALMARADDEMGYETIGNREIGLELREIARRVAAGYGASVPAGSVAVG